MVYYLSTPKAPSIVKHKKILTQIEPEKLLNKSILLTISL